MGFTPIGSTIDDKMNQDHALKNQIDATAVIEFAQKVFEEQFGKNDAACVKPLFLKNRTLTVTCSSSAVAQEIRLNQAEIVEKMNKVMDGDHVDRIRYLL
ncbi:MAG: DUF721 domain-containing protein [Candidatus Magasanikbacteria bacterium]|nr:DUF721 domain-containing protein [Candidatus Magasanikbacteria bacterium]MBT4071671.1 DUF721 domain-containing protein [Candidatus Magasanikbacteria bacterium]